MNSSILKKSVDEIVLDLPKQEQLMVKRLRELILFCLPYVTEKNSYGVPYYSHNRNMLFIWPPSIYWGPKQDYLAKKGVTLGFCQGNLMSNDEGLLKAEGRKQVYCIYFTDVKSIVEDHLRGLIFEAAEIDRQFQRKKRLSKKM